MITYDDSLFGFSLILRVHGSALWKAVVPALFSTGVLVAYVYLSGFDVSQRDPKSTAHFDHPYVITVYITFYSFLLTFRLNYAYQRYMEGLTAVVQMLSKWMDAATLSSVFHYQSKSYDLYRPASFGDNAGLRNLSRERERNHNITSDEYRENVLNSIEEKHEKAEHDKKQWWKLLAGASKKLKKKAADSGRSTSSGRSDSVRKVISGSAALHKELPAPRNFHAQWSVSDNTSAANAMSDSGRRFDIRRRYSQTSFDLKTHEPVRIPYPTLFLQEVGHLVSLLSGVALSTLRNDIPNSPSPLVEYFPGQPMPPVNPDELSALIRKDWEFESRALSALYYLMGVTRDERHRTLYNQARPFHVLGGVSDLEIQELQKAHGPYAKVALCSMYLQEFVAREYLNGSTGKIPGPLISRITHVLSDGMSGYNQARKLAYNPFPFPHAQMTTFFTLAVLFILPLLYYSYVNDIYFACILNFVTVLCFIGIHEVARELENPFHNVPNDLPLTTFQAQFNEALITIYSGFHPDSFWEADKAETTLNPSAALQSKENIHPLKR